MKLTVLQAVLASVTVFFHARNEQGAEVKTSLVLKGKTRSQDDWDALFKAHNETGDERVVADARFFAEVFEDWSVRDEHDQPLPLTVDNVQLLLRSTCGQQISGAFFRAIHDLRFGTPVKN